MVYPTLIAAVSDASHPNWRARGLSWAIGGVGFLTFLSGVIVAIFMSENDRPKN